MLEETRPDPEDMLERVGDLVIDLSLNLDNLDERINYRGWQMTQLGKMLAHAKMKEAEAVREIKRVSAVIFKELKNTKLNGKPVTDKYAEIMREADSRMADAYYKKFRITKTRESIENLLSVLEKQSVLMSGLQGRQNALERSNF